MHVLFKSHSISILHYCLKADQIVVCAGYSYAIGQAIYFPVRKQLMLGRSVPMATQHIWLHVDLMQQLCGLIKDKTPHPHIHKWIWPMPTAKWQGIQIWFHEWRKRGI